MFAPAIHPNEGAWKCLMWIEAASGCREEGVSQAILFNLCGHGHFDMQAYIDYAAGKLEDQDYSEEEVAMALAGLPAVAAA